MLNMFLEKFGMPDFDHIFFWMLNFNIFKYFCDAEFWGIKVVKIMLMLDTATPPSTPPQKEKQKREKGCGM